MSSRASGAGGRRGPSRGGTRKPGHLSDHDLRAWDAVSRSVTPFARHRRGAAGKPEDNAGSAQADRMTFLQALGEPDDRPERRKPVPKSLPRAAENANPATRQPGKEEKTRGREADDHRRGEKVSPHAAGNKSPARSKASHPSTRSAPGAAAAGAHLDENELKRVRSGRASISARLDLHGLRQHEAHAALRAFLYRAQSNGAKWALVITGKGSRSRSDRQLPGPNWQSEVAGSQGVLRAMVPVWLSEPEFRALVVGFRSAGRRHGGEGALYVRLRTRK